MKLLYLIFILISLNISVMGQKAAKKNPSLDQKTVLRAPIQLKDTASFLKFANLILRELLKNNESGTYQVKEYFFITITKEGKVEFLKDERTETNKNTKLITTEQLDKFKEIYFKQGIPATKYPIGIMVEIAYSEKIFKLKKNKKIRVYNDPFYLEYLKSNNPWIEPIHQKAAKDNLPYGKYTIKLIDTTIELAEFEGKEYNPFYRPKYAIYKKKAASVLRMTPVK